MGVARVSCLATCSCGLCRRKVCESLSTGVWLCQLEETVGILKICKPGDPVQITNLLCAVVKRRCWCIRTKQCDNHRLSWEPGEKQVCWLLLSSVILLNCVDQDDVNMFLWQKLSEHS